MISTCQPTMFLYAGERIFSAVPPQSLFVGTHPPVDFPGFVFQYKHPDPFGVQFQFDGRSWFLSRVQNVHHQCFLGDSASYVRSQYSQEGYRRDNDRFAPTWPLDAGFRLGTGLHIFWYDRYSEKSFDQFRVSILDAAVPVKDSERLEFTTPAQQIYERKAFFLKRIENAAAKGEADPHNVAILMEDLASRLGEPKKPEGGRVRLFPEGNLRAVLNLETGKLIGVLDATADLKSVIPASPDLVTLPMAFSEFTHRLGAAASFSSMKEIPLPAALLQAIEIFNQRIV